MSCGRNLYSLSMFLLTLRRLPAGGGGRAGAERRECGRLHQVQQGGLAAAAQPGRAGRLLRLHGAPCAAWCRASALLPRAPRVLSYVMRQCVARRRFTLTRCRDWRLVVESRLHCPVQKSPVCHCACGCCHHVPAVAAGADQARRLRAGSHVAGMTSCARNRARRRGRLGLAQPCLTALLGVSVTLRPRAARIA